MTPSFPNRRYAELEQRRTLLEAEIKAALTRGGNLVIPVFALERTQELLLDIAMLINTGRLAHPRVFIDSPLATRATEVFAKHASELEDMGSGRSEEHTSELQSLMRISYAVFCLNKKKKNKLYE